jgi:hypothetical protein
MHTGKQFRGRLEELWNGATAGDSRGCFSIDSQTLAFDQSYQDGKHKRLTQHDEHDGE